MTNGQVALVDKFEVSAEIPEDMIEATALDPGLGVSFNPEDQLLPLVYILQGLSPQVNKRGDSYVDGAEPGDFWLRGALQPIRNGEEGIKAIPCGMQRSWIEWLPERQGFVARHQEIPHGVQSKKVRRDDGSEMTVAMLGDNIIQDTREFYIMVEGHPYVLPCTSTKHTFARQWQSYFHQLTHPKTGGVMPSPSQLYLLTTVPVSNAKGDWFGLKFQFLGFVPKPVYEHAKAFANAVKRGERKAEAPISGAEGERSEEIPF